MTVSEDPARRTIPVAGVTTCVVATTVPVTAHRFLRDLMAALRLRGHRVTTVTGPGREADRQALMELGPHHTVAMRREIHVAADLRALAAWLRLLRRSRPGLLITMTPKASLLAMLCGAALRTPERVYLLAGLRLEGTTGTRRRLLWVMERLTSACATRVIANSPSLARRYTESGLVAPGKLRSLIPGSDHGVDVERFQPRARDLALAAQLGLDLRRPVVGFVGRLTADKGIADLIAALPLIRDDGAGPQLLVLGAQDEPDSANLVKRLEALDGVVVVDHVDDVRPYLSLMDLHVLPSHREGFPNIVLEAAAMHIPTVTSTATGCIDSVVDGVTGLHYPTGDVAALAAAISALLRDPRLRQELAAGARQRCLAEFRAEQVVARLMTEILTP